MSTLGIFTVKSIHRSGGRYYTYGGFGVYLNAIRARFDRCVLIAHVRNAPPRPGDYEIPLNNLEIIGLPPLRNELEALLTLPIQFCRCWRAVQKFDIAHARMPDYTGVIGALVCRLMHKPVFCQIIADWGLEARKTPWTKKCGIGVGLKIHLWLYDQFEKMVCRGQMVFAQGSVCYNKHRWTADSEMVVSSSHNLVDVVEGGPRFQRDTPIILNVARMNAVKNQRLLIDTIGLLRSQGEAWRLRLVGNGPDRSALVQHSVNVGVSDLVELIGEVEHGENLWRHFDDADVFALSSLSEGTPKVVLEAMARGLPVVATAVSGVPDMVVDRIRGLLVEKPDPFLMAAALRDIRNDKTLRAGCIQNAKMFALDNTVERQVDRMLAKVQSRWRNIQINEGGRNVV
jgi:glycosyltransferase involved in cell wall biosynthesis